MVGTGELVSNDRKRRARKGKLVSDFRKRRVREW